MSWSLGAETARIFVDHVKLRLIPAHFNSECRTSLYSSCHLFVNNIIDHIPFFPCRTEAQEVINGSRGLSDLRRWIAVNRLRPRWPILAVVNCSSLSNERSCFVTNCRSWIIPVQLFWGPIGPGPHSRLIDNYLPV